MDKPIPPQGYPGGEPHEWARPSIEAIEIYERELFAYNLALARGEIEEAAFGAEETVEAEPAHETAFQDIAFFAGRPD